MANIFNPMYLLGPPLLLVVSIPLAIFATITTTIAITALTVRVSIVYFELGVALIHAYLLPPSQKPLPSRSSSKRTSPSRPRTRRSSISSATSLDVPRRLHQKSDSLVSLIGTSDVTRDFEGVGGWRVTGGDDEEALWMGINSRLELPTARPKRRHQRSLTGGSQSQRWTWSPEALRMSPVQSRSRTPTFGITDDKTDTGDYFPSQSTHAIRPLSTASEPLGMSIEDARRASTGGSSTSSGGSGSQRTSSATKQSGE
ncbi:hypothetical protein K491DRAFT_707982 [Lophiostoma macrostomum CBS 122681]|uniref:Uncharacterized protein n=1 Tax=Lophiostoma macrostomum CBS 122681 TaxID=1314788 RepID=A0A6A6SU04_9PLEO|nr:hypothetical protein K491DRAFT_707982 [Lophiostoma macrostomum CBS 122681]